VTDYTDEEYEAWVMELIEFFRHWPYDVIIDPPDSPTRMGERGWSDDWRKKLH
jgi:hypothetical protein